MKKGSVPKPPTTNWLKINTNRNRVCHDSNRIVTTQIGTYIRYRQKRHRLHSKDILNVIVVVSDEPAVQCKQHKREKSYAKSPEGESTNYWCARRRITLRSLWMSLAGSVKISSFNLFAAKPLQCRARVPEIGVRCSRGRCGRVA